MAIRLRAALSIAASCMLLACSAPVQPLPTPASETPSPQPSALLRTETPPDSTASAQPGTPTASLPIGTVTSKVSVGPTTVALASDAGAWFGTVGDHDGKIGFATPSGKVRTAKTLPVVALAEDAEGLYAAEIALDPHGGTAESRIEKLNPLTLKTVATRSVVDPTGLAVSGDDLWVATADGVLYRLRTKDLSITARIPLSGTDWATIVVAGGSVWVHNSPHGHGHLIHRFDPADPTDIPTDPDAGSGAGALVANGDGVYAFLQSDAVASGRVLRIDASGMLGSADVPGAPGAMTLLGSSLWWVSADGTAGRLDGDLSATGTPITVGTEATCVTAGAGYIWICTSEGLVLVQPTTSPGTGRGVRRTLRLIGLISRYRPFAYPTAVSLSHNEPALLFWM